MQLFVVLVNSTWLEVLMFNPIFVRYISYSKLAPCPGGLLIITIYELEILNALSALARLSDNHYWIYTDIKCQY